jgi:SPP1 gp7 family putative phage head morphogenesis protein
MTAYERAIERARRALLAVEERAALAITAAYQPVIDGLAENLAALTDLIARAGRVTPAWLDRQDRYRQLLEQLETDLAVFAGAAAARTAGAQAEAVPLADEHAHALAIAALGPGPPGGDLEVHGHFEPQAPTLATELAGSATDGTPLGLLLLDVALEGARATRDTLRYAISTRLDPDALTEAVQQEAHEPLTRALTLHRTETLGAYRRATDVAYQQSTIIRQWRWHAAIGERTCVVCLAMHGTLHPVTEPLSSHPACRCTQLPVVPSWEDLGFAGVPDHRPVLQTGEEAFARLTRHEKLVVVGPAKLVLLESGEVTLMDMVRKTHSRRWGPGLREATVTELRAAA